MVNKAFCGASNQLSVKEGEVLVREQVGTTVVGTSEDSHPRRGKDASCGDRRKCSKTVFCFRKFAGCI